MIQEYTKIETEGASIQIKAGEISSFKASQKACHGIRVFDKGGVCTASFVGDTTEEELVEACLKGREGSVPYDYELPSDSTSSRDLAHPELRGLAALHDRTAEALDFLRSHNDHFIYSGKSASRHVSKTLGNSQGVSHMLEHDEAYWWITYKHKKSRNLIDGYLDAHSLSSFDFLDSVRRHLPLLDAFETLLTTPLGRRKVVITTPHEHLFKKLGESLRIDRYREGACLHAGKLGQKIFSEEFSLVDLRDDPSRSLCRPYDGEGVLAPKPLPLVTRGVFEGLICDLRNGRKYSAVSTGNGQRSFDSNATLGFNGLALAPGPRNLTEILKGLGECIFVALAMGGDSTDKGDFALPVNLAFLVQDGEFKGRLDTFTLKSSLQDMFGPALLGVSSDSFNLHGFNPCMVMEMEVLA